MRQYAGKRNFSFSRDTVNGYQNLSIKERFFDSADWIGPVERDWFGARFSMDQVIVVCQVLMRTAHPQD